jgi:hypothetical protein
MVTGRRNVAGRDTAGQYVRSVARIGAAIADSGCNLPPGELWRGWGQGYKRGVDRKLHRIKEG